MTDVTSFETTKKLLEAGFPRSEDWGTQYFIVNEPETKRTFQHSIGGSCLGNGSSTTIRASSSNDILKILGIGFVIGFDSVIEKWICYREGYSSEWAIYNENSAEAVAEMYLKVNQK